MENDMTEGNRKQRDMEVSDACRDNENDMVRAKRSQSRIHRLWLIYSCGLALCLLAVIRCFVGSGEPKVLGPSTVESASVGPASPGDEKVSSLREKRRSEMDEGERIKRREELERQKLNAARLKFLTDAEIRIRKYCSGVAATVEGYRRMLPLSEAERHFSQSERGAAFLASRDGLCGWGCCVALAYKMAYDKVKGTTRAADAIAPLVREHVSDEIEKGVAVYAEWTTDFREALAAEERAFAADLAVLSSSFEESVSVLSIKDAEKVGLSVEAFEREVMDHAREAAFCAAGVAVEAVMLKSSYAVIRSIVLRLAGASLAIPVKRAGSSLAAGGVCALIDGPLPIGDCVGALLALGGLGWSSWDIYSVTKTMPSEMEAKIVEGIRQVRTDVETTAAKNLKDAQQACMSAAKAKLAEINKMFKEVK